VTEMEHRFSPRTSWTATGSYSLLRFSGAGYVNSGNVLFQTGYEYRMTRQNTIGVLYRFDALRFTHLAQGVDEHIVWLSFARRISDQWRVEMAAGPNLEVFRARFSGPATHVAWSVNSSLTYHLERSVLRFSYDHGLTGGSGVLVGARTNQFQARVARSLTRRWQGSVTAGYARNESITQNVPGTEQAPFQSWYGRAGLSRYLTSGSSLSVGYSTRSQRRYGALCTGSNCGPTFTTHEISLGFSWGLRSNALQ